MPNVQTLRTLSVKNDFSPLLKLAIPLVLTGIIQSSLGFTENIFLSRLGEHSLAAGALVSWLFATLIVILFGVFSAVNILVAHKFGEKDHHGISLVLRDGLILALLTFIPTFFLLWYMAPLLSLFGQQKTLVILARAYLHGLAWGLLPKLILIVLFEFIIGLGHTRVVTLFSILSIPFYIFFSFSLIFGRFGLPQIGIAGAGWGITIGDWITAIALIAYVFSSRHYQRYVSGIFNFKKTSFLLEMLHLGLPLGLMYSFEVGFFFVISVFMGLVGIQFLAANQITMQYLGPLMGIIFSIAQAITVRMGHELGAGEINAAERAGYAGTIIAFLFMLLIAACYWLIPKLLIAVDFDVSDPKNSSIVQIAQQFFFIAAFFQILEATRIALFGALRALKDTKFTLLISVISFWVLSLPLGYGFVFWFNLGGEGFWISMVIGTTFSVILLLKRFQHKIKKYALAKP